MSTDRRIAWFGIGLSLLGLIPIFRDASLQLIVAYCLLFGALLAFFLYAAFRTSGPQYATLFLEKKLTIHEKDGSKASLERKQKIRVRYGSIQEVWCRSIYADGAVDNFQVDGVDVPAHDQLWSGPIVDLRKRFPEAIFSNHEAPEVVWTYDLHNSFPDKHEALDHEVTPGTQEVQLKVILPADRICKNAAMHELIAGDAVGQLDDPVISVDRRTITSTVKAPKNGHTLRLNWDW